MPTWFVTAIFKRLLSKKEKSKNKHNIKKIALTSVTLLFVNWNITSTLCNKEHPTGSFVTKFVLMK